MNKKPVEIVNIMLVSRWCYQSALLKVIGQFSLNGIGRETRIKFVIGYWSVSIRCIVSQIYPFVGLVFDLVTSFVRPRYLLTSVKKRLLKVGVPAFQSQSLSQSFVL